MAMSTELQERILKLAQECKSAGEASAQMVLTVLASSMQMHTDGTLAMVCCKYLKDVNDFTSRLLKQSGEKEDDDHGI